MIFGREPAVWIGVIVSCILAVVGVLTGQGVISDALGGHITDATNALAQILVLVAPLVTGVLIRGQVTPVAKG
jgi:citrate lyase alpha subunit